MRRHVPIRTAPRALTRPHPLHLDLDDEVFNALRTFARRHMVSIETAAKEAIRSYVGGVQ